MPQLVKFTENKTNNTLWYKMYQLVKSKRYISLYSEGKKYFLFAFKGRIFCFSEFSLCLILCSLSFIGTIGIRKLIKRFKMKKKFKKLLTSIRAGGDSLDLFDEKEILHYEDEINDQINFNYYLLPISSFKLSAGLKLLKGIVKKCLKKGMMYKLVHRGVLEVVNKIIPFKKKNNIRIISYDVLVLALIVALKPGSALRFKGTDQLIQTISNSFVFEHAPILCALIMAISSGVRVDLNTNIAYLASRFLLMLAKSAGTFQTVEFLRAQYFLDCTDYVKELPHKDRKDLIDVKGLQKEDSKALSTMTTTGEGFQKNDLDNSKIWYTREEPTRHDIFVATSRDQQLYYQSEDKNVVIETLDGRLKQKQKLNGDKPWDWVKYPEMKTPVESNYIPLKERTKTLADIVDLDTPKDHIFLSYLTKSIQEEQIRARVIEEAAKEE